MAARNRAIAQRSSDLNPMRKILEQYGPREAMEYDVVVVGAGPAGLATAIRLKQLAAAKAAKSGGRARERLRARRAHPVGRRHGPRAITELFPDWKERGAPLNQPVVSDRCCSSRRDGAFHPRLAAARLLPEPRQPAFVQPGRRDALAGQQAEGPGRGDLPRLRRRRSALRRRWGRQGVATGNMGISKDGEPTDELPARHGTARQIHHLRRRRARPPGQAADRQRFKLDAGRDPQSYGIGIKELWEIDAEKASPASWSTPPAGRWTLDDTYGGFLPLPPGRQQGHARLRHRPGLPEPWLSPFEEFQRWKTHPAIRAHLEGGKRSVWRARHHRRRHPEPAQDRVPGRRAGRL